MGGARLYRSQTTRVNAPVQPLLASGPQFHLLVRGADPDPVRGRFGAFVGILCNTVLQTRENRGNNTIRTPSDTSCSMSDPTLAI